MASFLVGRCCFLAWLDAELNIEEALLSNTPLFGGVFDIFKNFDSLPWDIILKSASALGLPQKLQLCFVGATVIPVVPSKLASTLGTCGFLTMAFPKDLQNCCCCCCCFSES